MGSPSSFYAIAGGLCVALFAGAFAAAPYSCEGGLGAYALAGLVVVVVLALLPFVLRRDASIARRFGLALGLAALGFGVWIAGMAAANVRIMCRLF